MNGLWRRGPAAIVGLILALCIGTVGAPSAAAAVIGVANPDSASVESHVTLTVAAPGVLANDTVVAGSKSAQLVSDVSNGTLTLSSNGGYTYRSDSGYVGIDSFRYRIPGGLLGLLPSLPATVTITVTAPPTPTPAPTPTPTPRPTPSPTPKPTSTPTSTPSPTPTPTPKPTVTTAPTLSPTPRPTPTPSPTPRPTSLPNVTPLPTVVPLPTLPPIGSPTPTPARTSAPSPTPRPTAAPASTPSPSTSLSRDPGVGGGPVAPSSGGSAGSGGSGGGKATAPPAFDDGPFAIAAPDRGGTVELDPSSIVLTGFEWAVPALVLTVPGLFLIIAVVLETLIGLAWFPVARRWVGRDEHAARRRRRLSAS